LDRRIRAFHLKRRPLTQVLQETLRDHGVPYEQHDTPPAEAANPGLRWVRRRERVNPLLCWAATDCCGLAFLGHSNVVIVAVISGAVVAMLALNAPFYAFATKRHGAWCLWSVVPLHFGGSMLMGTARLTDQFARWLVGEPRPAPAIEAFAEVGLKTWPPVPIRRAPIVSQSARA
jgi:hypothetical protein